MSITLGPSWVPVRAYAPWWDTRDAYVRWWADTLVYGPVVDMIAIKIRAARSGKADTFAHGKCMLNGEPLLVKHHVPPVAGSVRENVAGEFRGASVANPVR